MTCCPATIQSFSNVAVTEINYSNDLRSKHGEYPKVQVLYYNEEKEEFDLSIDATQVKLVGSPVETISIDHGGLMSGFVKLT